MGLKRRAFLIGTLLVAGAGVYGWRRLTAGWGDPLDGRLSAGDTALTDYLAIGEDNSITIICPQAEMGQGVTTTLAALVAEELDLPLGLVTVRHDIASGAYGNVEILRDGLPLMTDGTSALGTIWTGLAGVVGPALGLQVTGASTSVRDAFDRMRMAGATARALLAESASIELGVPKGSLAFANARIIHQVSGRSLSFAEAVRRAEALPLPAGIQPKPRGEWMLLGNPQTRVDGRAKATGRAPFGIDVDLPDMLHGTVILAPRFGQTISTVSDAAARGVSGVQAIVRIATHWGDGVVVAADTTWAAFKAAGMLDVAWADDGSVADDARVGQALDAALAAGGGWVLRETSDVGRALGEADSRAVMRLDYDVPFLAHATMEPMNATARWANGVLDVWAPTQAPSVVQFACARALDIPNASVQVHPTLLGGGFGRRAEADFALIAALAARETAGRPVQVTWSRETDMTHDLFRPAAKARITALPGGNGVPGALSISIAAPSPTRSIANRLLPSAPVAGPDRFLAEGLFDTPYAFQVYRSETIDTELGVPVGFWRSVGYAHNTFFLECALDEIAVRSSADPLTQRLALLDDDVRARAVLVRVAERSGWKEPKAGLARGLAYLRAYGSDVACVAEVSGSLDALKIERLVIVADVGVALDPSLVTDQLVSGTVFGLGAAMNQAMSFSGGAANETNFDGFEPLRLSACPVIDTEVLQTGETPGGVGELAVPVIAPAVANAIFALTGERIRSLPLNRQVTFA
jgi:isoquinoline 1-oxidoreductase subunit beta